MEGLKVGDILEMPYTPLNRITKTHCGEMGPGSYQVVDICKSVDRHVATIKNKQSMKEDKDYVKMILDRRYLGWKRWLFRLGISRARRSKVNPKYVHTQGFNPFNPLAWLLFVLLFLTGIFVVGLPQVVREAKYSFKFK